MPTSLSPGLAPCCPVVELRQYTLHPSQRDALITLFDREFVETQEAVGIRVLAQFRDLDDADRFVWLRGFADMPARAEALTAFYGGPVWQQHRDAANVTMIDSDNVLLLKPAATGSGFDLPDVPRPAQTSSSPAAAAVIMVATIYYLDAGQDSGFAEFFAQRIAPVLAANGTEVLASFVTESAPNTFPRLPVREGERVFVWFAQHADAEAYNRHAEAVAASARWRGIQAELRNRIARTETLRLAPTARSLLPMR